MMKSKRITFGFLLVSMLLASSLACNFVTRMVLPPTVTPPATATLTPPATLTPTPLMPAYVPPECAAVPLATTVPDLSAQATPEFPVTPVPQGEQLTILRKVGDIVETNYVYPDYNGKDWTEIESRYRREIESGLDAEAFYSEMSNMIMELGDDHSFFLSPMEATESEAELKGDINFVGVGIYGEPDFARQRLIVISTYPDSPAEHAGIQDHDSILAVDENPITEQFSGLLRGPQCSAVKLTVQSPGEAPRDVMLVRYAIQGNIPIEARLVTTTDGSKIGYIFIPSFFDETIPGQIKNALNEFGPLDGLILDLRMNGGGSSTVTYPIMEYFLHGRLGQFVSREEARPLEIDAHEVQNSQSVPLIVMVSKETVSFGEIFAGVMKDSGRARIVGETSLGNVEVLHGFDFEDGSQLWLAAETFHSAFSDTDWEETGIVPDVQAFADWDTFYFDTDPSVAAAVELLGHQ